MTSWVRMWLVSAHPTTRRLEGDVADITAIEVSPGPEGALNEVQGHLGRRVGHGGPAPTLLAPSLQTRLEHEAAHPALPAVDAALVQLLVDPG